MRAKIAHGSRGRADVQRIARAHQYDNQTVKCIKSRQALNFTTRKRAIFTSGRRFGELLRERPHVESAEQAACRTRFDAIL
jgi:hypothetical protein